MTSQGLLRFSLPPSNGENSYAVRVCTIKAGKSRSPLKSWRDILPVHEACDLFPLMSKDELQDLANDIKKNGLREKAKFTAIR